MKALYATFTYAQKLFIRGDIDKLVYTADPAFTSTLPGSYTSNRALCNDFQVRKARGLGRMCHVTCT